MSGGRAAVNQDNFAGIVFSIFFVGRRVACFSDGNTTVCRYTATRPRCLLGEALSGDRRACMDVVKQFSFASLSIIITYVSIINSI
jgi:hypothetical protein